MCNDGGAPASPSWSMLSAEKTQRTGPGRAETQQGGNSTRRKTQARTQFTAFGHGAIFPREEELRVQQRGNRHMQVRGEPIAFVNVASKSQT